MIIKLFFLNHNYLGQKGLVSSSILRVYDEITPVDEDSIQTTQSPSVSSSCSSSSISPKDDHIIDSSDHGSSMTKLASIDEDSTANTERNGGLFIQEVKLPSTVKEESKKTRIEMEHEVFIYEYT